MTPQLSLRHVNATLGYRAAKALRDAPAEFSSFRIGDGSRSAGQILAHLCDLMDWALSIARGVERWQDTEPRSWTGDSARFLAALTAFDEYVASGEPWHVEPERVFQGALADALTHVGQVAMMRRLAGAPVRGENYYVAHIQAGRTGADQPAPVFEFD